MGVDAKFINFHGVELKQYPFVKQVYKSRKITTKNIIKKIIDVLEIQNNIKEILAMQLEIRCYQTYNLLICNLKFNEYVLSYIYNYDLEKNKTTFIDTEIFSNNYL